MEGSLKDLSNYRLETAKEDLERAEREYEIKDYKLSLNRSYYAFFHSMRAVNSLDGFDSSKHSGVIAHFNQYHVKNGDFPKNSSKMIKEAMEIRQKSDYEDFYIASEKKAKEQLKNAKLFVELVEQFLKESNL